MAFQYYSAKIMFYFILSIQTVEINIEIKIYRSAAKMRKHVIKNVVVDGLWKIFQFQYSSWNVVFNVQQIFIMVLNYCLFIFCK